MSLVTTLGAPAALGLLGFVEPCSIAASVLFVRYLEGKSVGRKIAETALFATTRALFMGGLGVLAALVGSRVLGLQRGGWIALGVLYVLLGALHASGRAGLLIGSLGPGMKRLRGLGGSAGLGVLFGLNVPACAAPLLAALLAGAAAGGGGWVIAGGFVSLGVFGLALSLPLVAAVLVGPARRFLDSLAVRSRRVPLWTGAVLVALGLWSIGFGLRASPEAGGVAPGGVSARAAPIVATATWLAAPGPEPGTGDVRGSERASWGEVAAYGAGAPQGETAREASPVLERTGNPCVMRHPRSRSPWHGNCSSELIG